MRVPEPLWKSNRFKYLVIRKFPLTTIFNEDSGIAPLEGRTHPTDGAANAYSEKLLELPPAELARLVAEARSADEAARVSQSKADEENRPFNRPAARADFDYWSKASFWTVEEATALSFGRDPRTVDLKAVRRFADVSPFAQSFVDRLKLLERARITGQLGGQTAPPVALAWARRMQIAVPDELTQAVENIGAQVADWKTLYDREKQKLEEAQAELATLRSAGANGSPAALGERSFGTRERESLLKLVIGMAIKGYAHQPSAGRAPTATEIASDLAKLGLSLSDDTIRKYLREGAELLPPPEIDQGR